MLHACWESRQAVEALYLGCFGSFLQPKRVRFNFGLYILYLDYSQNEEGLYYFLGILKEIELARLKYVAINEEYLINSYSYRFSFNTSGSKESVKGYNEPKRDSSCS